MFNPTDKKFITIRDFRLLLLSKSIFKYEKSNDINLYHLNADNQFQGIEWFVSRLDSNYNFYKVESHTILTKMLFLVCTHQCAFSFDEHKVVCIVMADGETVYLKWDLPDDLMKITWVMLASSTHISEDSHSYNAYRQATRSITNHLSEDHQPRDTWTRILKLTSDYFNGNKDV